MNTRYRDITLEELREAHPPSKGFTSASIHDWEAVRGAPLVIETPHTNRISYCGSPEYRVLSGPISGSFVCSHLAEIGD